MPQQLEGNIKQQATMVASADMVQERTGAIIDLQSKDQFEAIISICYSLSSNILLLVDIFSFCVARVYYSQFGCSDFYICSIGFLRRAFRLTTTDTVYIVVVRHNICLLLLFMARLFQHSEVGLLR